MTEKIKPRILTPKDTYTIDYPAAVKAAENQAKIIWFATELGVEKDAHNIKTELTDGERHGLITTLKLFTQYELKLGGEEFWGGKISKMFPRPEIQRMAATFSFTELGIHAPFYNLVNETLNINTDAFYNEWKQEPVLVARMEYIEKFANSKCPLLTTSAFAFMEGGVLFSNFAYIKSLNSGGFNMASHTAAGIDASAKDENFHAMASAWLFNQTLFEMKELGLMTKRKETILRKKIYSMAQTVYEHELQIIDLIFSGGEIRTITKENMVIFIKNRIDAVLGFLNMEPLFKEPEGDVSKWFYNALSSYKYADFFANQQIQYVRDWAVHKLVFNKNAGV